MWTPMGKQTAQAKLVREVKVTLFQVLIGGLLHISSYPSRTAFRGGVGGGGIKKLWCCSLQKQPSFFAPAPSGETRNATRDGSEEGRLLSQASSVASVGVLQDDLFFSTGLIM